MEAYIVSVLLPNNPDRKALIDHILQQLKNISFAVEIRTPEPLIEQKLAVYFQGEFHNNRVYRGMNLDVWVDISGKKAAEFHLEEVSDELVMFNFEFDPSEVRYSEWDMNKHEINHCNIWLFRDLLLSLNNIYPVLIGTLAIDLWASIFLGLDNGEEFSLANKLSLEQLLTPILEPNADYNYDFAIINPAASGGNKPFVCSYIGEPKTTTSKRWTELQYHDLERVQEIRAHEESAEKAYDKMYDEPYPLINMYEAVRFLSMAITLATDMGLEKEALRLKERHEHIISEGETELKCYGLERVKEMRAHEEWAEKAYDRMYDAPYPLSDKDEAVRFLSMAIRLATDMGLEQEALRLKERQEHIIEVFNAQFRFI